MNQPASDGDHELVGRRLYSVVFVEDYIQLLFDPKAGEDGAPPHLDFFVLPKVMTGQELFEPSDVRWAWALTTLIGSKVVAFRESCEVGLELELDAGALSLQANRELNTAVEVALLEVQGVWGIWRPGEGPFQA